MKNGQYERRTGVQVRLEAQLKKGTKEEKISGKTTGNMIPLSDNDVKRIKKEIDTLSNILKGESA